MECGEFWIDTEVKKKPYYCFQSCTKEFGRCRIRGGERFEREKTDESKRRPRFITRSRWCTENVYDRRVVLPEGRREVYHRRGKRTLESNFSFEGSN